MKKPNIIFYFSDQQRWDTCGCYGQKLPVTPVIDQLAEEGTLFDNAFTCQPVCGPARSCLQSGKYATQTGCYRNGVPLPLNIPTLAGYFRESGYDTAYIGKWHLASGSDDNHFETIPVPEERRGGWLDYWMASDILEFTSHGYNGYVFDRDGKKHEFIGYRPDCINNYAIDYLHSRNRDKPFFMFVSHIDPHHQNDHKCFEGPDGSKRRFKDYEVPGDLVGTEGDWRQNYPDYLGQCNSIDSNVGRLIETLKDQGIWDNTILIYTSDHGSHFCTRNKEYKRSCHDSSIHIPMIAHGPGFNGIGHVSEMVSLIDIPPTLLDCAGISVPDDFQGNSLKKLISGDNADWPDDVFLQISENHIGRAVRTAHWKYSVRAVGDGWTIPDAKVYYEDYLYNLDDDPHERNNLVSDPSLESVRADMASRLKKYMKKAGEAEPEILPRDQRPD